MEDQTPAERGWFYRRWYTFISSVFYAAALTTIILKVEDNDVLKWIALALIGTKIIIDTLYMAGASVLDYAKLAAGWKGNAEAHSGEGKEKSE
jgi:hypothetical protein